MHLNLYTKGISRDNWHKRRKTGGKRKPVHQKRKYELGRPPANQGKYILLPVSLRQCGWWKHVLRLVIFGRFGQRLWPPNVRICHSYSDTWPSSKYIFIGLCHVLYIFISQFYDSIDGPCRIHTVRVRGGNKKYRALRLDVGNFSWGSECEYQKCFCAACIGAALSMKIICPVLLLIVLDGYLVRWERRV